MAGWTFLLFLATSKLEIVTTWLYIISQPIYKKLLRDYLKYRLKSNNNEPHPKGILPLVILTNDNSSCIYSTYIFIIIIFIL